MVVQKGANQKERVSDPAWPAAVGQGLLETPAGLGDGGHVREARVRLKLKPQTH